MTHHAAAAPSAAAHHAEARTATHYNLASSTLVSEGTRLTVCLFQNNCTFLTKRFYLESAKFIEVYQLYLKSKEP